MNLISKSHAVDLIVIRIKEEILMTLVTDWWICIVPSYPLFMPIFADVIIKLLRRTISAKTGVCLDVKWQMKLFPDSLIKPPPPLVLPLLWLLLASPVRNCETAKVLPSGWLKIVSLTIETKLNLFTNSSSVYIIVHIFLNHNFSTPWKVWSLYKEGWRHGGPALVITIL